MNRELKIKIIFISVGSFLGFLFGLVLIWMFNNYGAY